MMRTVELPPLAITMGEPAGIGLEVTLKAWKRRQRLDLPAFFLMNDPARVAETARLLDIDAKISEIDSPARALSRFDDTIPVLPVSMNAPVVHGKPDPENAPLVIESIEQAVKFALAGDVAGMVTPPIHKAVLLRAGFKHPGHTDFIAELCGAQGKAVMMVSCPGFHSIPVTVHLPLKEALRKLTKKRIVDTIRTADLALRRDYSIEEPRLAVAGLNPHAGEGGLLGREELDVISPALEELAKQGIPVAGPVSPDTLFTAEARKDYDCAICMYHDQALIPLKTIDFEHGVNTTLGLPIVRTSPDHGTALALAGQGASQWSSMVAAIWTAAMIARRRSVLPEA
ncbi:MAG: 4-hydroxythreonine-4-phosphate dehydrogenase PdxA [Alphaproteobacteria bacterium]